MTSLPQVADYSFDPQVLKIDIPVLALFWAEWSASSKKLIPIVTELAEEYSEQLRVVSLNLDDTPVTASDYSVMNLPTLILFKFGQPVERIIGSPSKEEIIAQIEPYLDEMPG